MNFRCFTGTQTFEYCKRTVNNFETGFFTYCYQDHWQNGIHYRFHLSTFFPKRNATFHAAFLLKESVVPYGCFFMLFVYRKEFSLYIMFVVAQFTWRINPIPRPVQEAWRGLIKSSHPFWAYSKGDGGSCGTYPGWLEAFFLRVSTTQGDWSRRNHFGLFKGPEGHLEHIQGVWQSVKRPFRAYPRGSEAILETGDWRPI